MNAKLNLSPLGKAKLAVHAVQGILIFLTACIAIAMDAQSGHTDGRGIWFNLLCYLTIPALIYVAVVPMWERSQRFANVYAFLAIDVLFAIFWLSAWAALVSWARAGIQSGAALKKLDSGAGNCTTFDPAFGTPEKCHLANTCVGFGVVIFVTFIATAVLSYLYLRRIMRDATVTTPWLGKEPYSRTGGGGVEAGKDNTWSADPQDAEEDGGPGMVAAGHHRTGSDGTERGGNQEEDEYQLLHAGEAEYGRRPERRWDNSNNIEDDNELDQHNRYDGPPRYDDTEYSGRGRQSYHAPSGAGHDGFGEQSGAAFPSAPYGYGGPMTPREGI